ncbi:uncharacterized protein [Salminus brasiliensis]|uniref:uncharacterized protein n=1 Tax=Salminus brasiliensis TaxID=930266 RepID=UPI003B82D909
MGSESALRECKHVKEYQSNLIERVICSEILEQPSIFFSTPPITSINLYSHHVLWSNNFTITCSTKPQFPGGVFHLKVPWTISSYTQKAVNYSTTFFFPKAENFHEGRYSCVYENQVGFEMTKGSRISVHNITSQSQELHLFMSAAQHDQIRPSQQVQLNSRP